MQKVTYFLLLESFSVLWVCEDEWEMEEVLVL